MRNFKLGTLVSYKNGKNTLSTGTVDAVISTNSGVAYRVGGTEISTNNIVAAYRAINLNRGTRTASNLGRPKSSGTVAVAVKGKRGRPAKNTGTPASAF